MSKVNENAVKKAIRLYKKGYAIKDIANNLGKSPRTIGRILVKAGVHQVKSPLTPEERKEVIELLLSGKTLTEVAQLLDLEREYIRKLVYRTDDSYYIENDTLAIKGMEPIAEQLELSIEDEPETETMTVSFVSKEKDCITTILLDAMIKSEEGSEILRRKGFMPVVKEIEAAVEAIIN